jgi:hypothetical protein
MWRMNIAPTDDDVFDPEAYVDRPTSPARAAALAELALGLRDVVRDRWPNERVFTYWDYRAGVPSTSGCGSIWYRPARRSLAVSAAGPAGAQGKRQAITRR